MGHLIPATQVYLPTESRIDTLGAENLSPEEAERIEGVALPTPEFNAEGSTEEALHMPTQPNRDD